MRRFVAIASASAVALIWACGGDGTSAVDAGADASADRVVPDTSPPLDVIQSDTSQLPDIDGGPMCDPGKPFDPPTLVAELDTSGTEASLRLSFDQLTAYFTSSRPGGQGGQDLWVATRAKVTDAFSNIKNLDTQDSPQVDTHASITADGLTLVYESTRISPSQSVFVAKRADTMSAFGQPNGITGLGNFAIVTDPFVRADGQKLYFAAAPNGGDLDIFRANRSGKNFIGTTNVGELNSQAQEELPTVSPDDRLMYIASTRVEPNAQGGFDIWVSTRYSVNAPFTSPTLVKELNTPTDDFPDYVSPDGCTLYFHRSQSGDGGPTKAIWAAHKSM